MAEHYPITVEQITKLWKTYINDSSLRSQLRFGQFVLNRTLPRGLCWPDCYYASGGKDFNMLLHHATGQKIGNIRKCY